MIFLQKCSQSILPYIHKYNYFQFWTFTAVKHVSFFKCSHERSQCRKKVKEFKIIYKFLVIFDAVVQLWLHFYCYCLNRSRESYKLDDTTQKFFEICFFHWDCLGMHRSHETIPGMRFNGYGEDDEIFLYILRCYWNPFMYNTLR